MSLFLLPNLDPDIIIDHKITNHRVAIWLYNVKEFGGMLFADLASDWTFLLYFSMVIKSDFYFSNL